MYHSTALLLPDGRVLSMGGGHRDFNQWAELAEYPISEYLEPLYSSQNAVRPTFEIVDSSESRDVNFLAWGGWLHIEVDNDVPVQEATLIRLGATTHGFDQDQRLVTLDLEELDEMGENFYAVSLPELPQNMPSIQHRHMAPPGYYMLFLLSNTRQPSIGMYLRVGAPGSGAGYGIAATPSDEVQL